MTALIQPGRLLLRLTWIYIHTYSSSHCTVQRWGVQEGLRSLFPMKINPKSLFLVKINRKSQFPVKIFKDVLMKIPEKIGIKITVPSENKTKISVPRENKTSNPCSHWMVKSLFPVKIKSKSQFPEKIKPKSLVSRRSPYSTSQAQHRRVIQTPYI